MCLTTKAALPADTPKALKPLEPFAEVLSQLEQMKGWLRALAAKAATEQRALAERGIMCPDIEAELLQLKYAVRKCELHVGHVAQQIEERRHA